MQRLDGLDALRGFCALGVAVYHTIMLQQLIPPAEIPNYIGWLYMLVPLFFAISAFSMTLGYRNRVSSRSEISSFYFRRLMRIAPLFYMMLVVWICIIIFLWGGEFPSFGAVTANITFSFNLFPSFVASIVPAGWSLGNEALFYLSFPALMLAIRGLRSALLFLLLSMAIAVFSGIMLQPLPDLFAWFSISTQAPFFFAGILMFFIFQRLARLSLGVKRALSSMGFGATLFLLFFVNWMGGKDIGMPVWAVGQSLIALSLMPLVLSFTLHAWSPLVNRVTVYIGRVSYGLYLIHPAVIIVIANPLKFKIEAALPNWAVIAVCISTVVIVTLAIATASYYLFERPLSKIQIFSQSGRLMRRFYQSP